MPSSRATSNPYFLLQLACYAELLAAVQGAVPEHVHVILGDSRQESFRLADFAAYFRQVRKRFLAELGGTSQPVPDRVEHCTLCDWAPHCDTVRLAADHLSQVAGISRPQIARLTGHNIPTMASLASTPSNTEAACASAWMHMRA